MTSIEIRVSADIEITDNAIIPLKERVVDDFYDPVRWLVRKITKKTKGK